MSAYPLLMVCLMTSSALSRDVPAQPKVGRSRRGVDTRPLVWPSIAILLIWMIVPLALTLWFSFRNFNLTDPSITGWAGLGNYIYLVTDDSFTTSIINTVLLVGGVLLMVVWAIIV